MFVSVTPSRHEFTGSLELSKSLQLLLAPYLRPPSNPLLRILLFLFLWPNARGERWFLPMHWGTFSAQTRTERDSCGWLMCRTNWQSQRVRYFLRPTKLRWSRKENLAGKAPRPGGGFTRKHDRRAANSLASWTNKDRHAPCAITFSPHRRCPPWKKFGRQPVR